MRRVVLSLLILAVLWPSAAFARIGFLCRFDGELRAACCCPDAGKQELSSTATLRTACCCTRLTAAAPSHAPTAHQASRAPVPDPAALVAVAPLVIVPSVRVAIPPPLGAPPDPDRSLFVRHCALLL